MAGKLNTSTTTDAGTDTTLIGLILRPIEITLCVLFLWFGSMLLMMFLFDVTEKALIIGDPMEILAKLDSDPAHAASLDEPVADWWLRTARLLIDGQEENLEAGESWRPGLAAARERLARIRAHALPRTPEEARRDMESHPRFQEYRDLDAEILWRRRMLGEEPWPDRSVIEAQLALDEVKREEMRQYHREISPWEREHLLLNV